MAVSFFEILIMLFVLGGGAIMLLIIALALINKRPGIAAAFGGLVLLAIGVAAVAMLGTRTASSVSHSEVYPEIKYSESSTFVPFFGTPLGEPPGSTAHVSWGISLFPLLFIGAAVIAFIVAMIARMVSNKPAAARGSWWPVLLLVPLVALFVVGNFRYRVSRSHSGPIVAEGFEAMHHDFGPQHAEAARAEARRAAERNELIAEEIRAKAAGRAEAMSAQLQRQFASMDIHALMDLFEAPKIELSAEAPVPLPPAPPVAAPPVAAATVSKTILAEAEVEPTEKVAEAVVDNAEIHGDDKEVKAENSSNEASRDVDDEEVANEKHKPLPEWVDDQPGMVGDDWREVVATDEYATAEECRRATDIYLMLKTVERIETLAGDMLVDNDRPSITFSRDMIQLDGNVVHDGRRSHEWNDHRLRLLSEMGLGIDDIRRSVVREQHLTSRDSARALDTVYKQYTLAQFTPSFDAQLRRHWDKYRRSERFAMVGAGAGSVLGLLGLVFGLLKIDTWTKGYYTKRLFIGVPAAIISGIVLLSLFVGGI